MCVCKYVCKYVCVFVYMCVCVYVYICMCVCKYVCMYVHMYIHSLHMYVLIHTCIHIHTYICSYNHACIQTHIVFIWICIMFDKYMVGMDVNIIISSCPCFEIIFEILPIVPFHNFCNQCHWWLVTGPLIVYRVVQSG